MRQQGKVIKWVDDKGYGFVTVDSQAEQVFVHVSAFPKGQGRPIIGEAITFEIAIDAKKGMQAYNVLYLNRVVRTRNQPQTTSIKKQRNYSIFGLLFLIISGYFIWTQFNLAEKEIVNPVNDEVELLEQSHTLKIQKFQCASKTHCAEMISCDEAMFYLQNCPGTIADGDGDGVPCEDQWCGH
ncbi:MAG TPA: cold shock domain-containing protein [Methylotenera sp.]|nr:cold shock domain-containing protein [Methylotenera sp.]